MDVGRKNSARCAEVDGEASEWRRLRDAAETVVHLQRLAEDDLLDGALLED